MLCGNEINVICIIAPKSSRPGRENIAAAAAEGFRWMAIRQPQQAKEDQRRRHAKVCLD